MSDSYVDGRGSIQDLLTGGLDSVTEIFTRKGAVRGNHVHDATAQWTYVVSGRLLVASQENGIRRTSEIGPTDLLLEPAGMPHAWKALEDTRVLVFTRGPRSGADYESDVKRLAPEDRLL